MKPSELDKKKQILTLATRFPMAIVIAMQGYIFASIYLQWAAISYFFFVIIWGYVLLVVGYTSVWFAYVRNFTDIVIITVIVYFTGIVSSPWLILYAAIVTGSSLHHSRNRGVVSVVLSVLSFIFLVLCVKMKILPFVNLTAANPDSDINLLDAAFVSLILVAICTQIHVVTHKVYKYSQEMLELARAEEKRAQQAHDELEQLNQLLLT